MHDFKEYLMKKFGKSVREISSTEFENELINNDFKMICWDDVATYFNKTNGEFKGEFSTADGLYVLEKEDKIQLFFFEFKNVNYSDDADRQMSIFHLKNILEQMKECDKGCRLHESIDMILNHL